MFSGLMILCISCHENSRNRNIIDSGSDTPKHEQSNSREKRQYPY